MPNTQTETFDGESIEFEIYLPNDSNPDILFVHHGSSRSTYSSGSEDVADEEGLAVFAPIFPESKYDSDEYQRGGIVDDSDRVLPEDQWTTRLEEPMIDWARSQVGGDADVYLFGFSAGGQFLSRVAAYERPQNVSRIVVGSPSTWVLPSLTEDGPYGFDGLGTDAEERQALQEYLALPMTIYLGSEDDDPNDPDLSTSAAAMRQGSNRLERGINTFEMGQEVAEANGWEFNWSLVIADGVGHSGSSMLRAPEMIEALHPVDVPANGVPYDIALAGSSVDETAAGGTVVGRLSAKDPDGDALGFSVTGNSRFAVKGSDLVVVAGADLTGNGDRQVNLTVSASDGHGGVAKANVAVTIKDTGSAPPPGDDLGNGRADTFRFDLDRRQTVTRDVDFLEGDRVVLFDADRGSFQHRAGGNPLEVTNNGTRTVLNSTADVSELDESSSRVTTDIDGDDLVLIVRQSNGTHRFTFEDMGDLFA